MKRKFNIVKTIQQIQSNGMKKKKKLCVIIREALFLQYFFPQPLPLHLGSSFSHFAFTVHSPQRNKTLDAYPWSSPDSHYSLTKPTVLLQPSTPRLLPACPNAPHDSVFCLAGFLHIPQICFIILLHGIYACSTVVFFFLFGISLS